MIICLLGMTDKLQYEIINSINENRVIILNDNKLDLTDIDKVYLTIKEIQPDVIIHSANYNDVLKCKKDPELAYTINVKATKNIVQIAETIKSKLTYISTAYVFDGNKKRPYHEMDKPKPINNYGKTVYADESFIQNNIDNYYIVRTGVLFGHEEENFIKSTLNLVKANTIFKVVNDQIINLAYIRDLSEAIIRLLFEHHSYGIYHLMNEGCCSWFEVAQKIFEIKNMSIKTIPISIKEIQEEKVYQRNFSLKNNSSIKLRSWEEALEDYLKR